METSTCFLGSITFNRRGGRGMRIYENSPTKMAKFSFSKTILRNGKIVYYQDILQLPVPLNTLHTMHLNAKSLNLL